MNAAERRVAELLERWQASVERHAAYLDLDDAAYVKIQRWPRHQRPSRWLVDLARSRLNDLRQQLDKHVAMGDAAFAESLELMGFLTTLLGSEHVERFIPYAVPETRKGTAAEPAPAKREQHPAPVQRQEQRAPEPPAVARPRALKSAAPAAKPAKVDKPPKPDKAAATVIADAARLLSWGREWPHLAGLIARLADRPPEQEVWAILRTHRAAIEQKARRVPD